MALLLVPYTNAMRLGQGFNSYTQQICVDDAVVVNNDRAENVLLNDGTTMRILAQSQSKPSAWTRQKEIVIDNRAVSIQKGTPKAMSAKPKRPAVGELEDVPQDPASNAEDDPAEGASEEQGPIDDEPATEADEDPEDTPAETDEASLDAEDEPEANEPTAPMTLGAGRQRSATVRAGTTINPEYPIDTEPSTVVNERTSKGATGQAKLRRALAVHRAQQQKDDEERELMRQMELDKLREQREYQKKLEAEKREEDRIRRQEERDEQRKIRAEKRAFEEKRREEIYKAINNAASSKSKAMTMEEMKAIAKQNQFTERWDGLGENTQEYVFDANAPRGPSQTVTYTSRFVDRLSDITDDMCISGSLSIKSAKVGGSGRGSFIDSDKFKESDLNFYISVKVVNQTINFKDALEFNPVGRSVGDQNFNQVYGDSFISGFQEGGEFNAVVSMKILNKAKKTDIQAEAKVAFTAGPMSVEAEANVGIARENIETNTETTIQVSWMGGGHIKPMEQQWDIKSLMAAAARFPDLVADCPQRTYAILTKYDHLRSFVARKPAAYSKLQYENAQLYTNVLMEAFMSYKTLYKQISDYMFQIKQKTMEIVPWETKDAADAAVKSGDDSTAVVPVAAPPKTQFERVKDPKTGLYPYVEDNTRFEATMSGLDQARKAIRRQMSRIVNEVDEIERDPKRATDEDHEEPFQPPASFEMRVPSVDVPQRLRPQPIPLTGKRIQAKPQTEEERLKEAQELQDLENAPPLHPADEVLEADEVAAFAKCVEDNPGLGNHLQVSQSVGSLSKVGKWFNNLDFLRENWHIKTIKARVAQAVLRAVWVEYDNGLVVTRGLISGEGRVFELGSFAPGERITSGAIETGIQGTASNAVLLSLHLHTNYGRSLVAQCDQSKPFGDGGALKDNLEFREVRMVRLDNPYSKGTLKGFFGRVGQDSPGPERLGFIWGDVLPQNDTTSGSSSVVPSTTRRVLPSRWGQTRREGTLHSANFGITYFNPPQVLYALSEVRSYDCGNMPGSWNMDGKTIDNKGFTLTTNVFPDSKVSTMDYSWLSLPDNEVNFNVGYYDFEKEIIDTDSNTTGSHNVVFAKPYKTVPATPAIWCVSLDFSATGGVSSPRLGAEITNLTTTGFTLTIKTWGGSRHAGNWWGWCVWDKEYDGVKVKTGFQDWGGGPNASLVQGQTKFWEPDFGGKKPVSIMTGISGFDVNIERNNNMLHMQSKFTGQLDNGLIRYGPDETARGIWMRSMYVAILED